ncbi:MAG: Holliday junction branch migration protein RuvA [Dehalococcoidia bacterium]|nr:Holliday junction branch migration protein RuvA [Dehalococcoidia bacterium]
MIASLRGTIESLGNEAVVINVGGVGFEVFMPVATLLTLGGLGENVRVYTHTHVREDAILLYGFSAQEDLELFQILINVSGVGPKLALMMFSTMNAEQLVSAIAGGSEELLTSIPGIGKKLAGRIILELKDKLKSGWAGVKVVPVDEQDGEVVAALLQLGYSASEASRAVSTIPYNSKLSLEDKLKRALAYFGGVDTPRG